MLHSLNGIQAHILALRLLMQYELVLWDFDGTLANTLTVGLDIYNRLAQAKRFKLVEDPHAVRDMSMRQFLASHNVPMYRVPFLFSEFLSELKSRADRIGLNPGIQHTLASICEMGIRQGIVSSNSTDTIRLCLASNGVENRFEYVSGTSRIFGKEKRIRSAVQELGVSKSRVLYVGDEIRDIDAANAAGFDVAAVGWGLNSREALLKSGPTYFVAKPSQLADVLRGEFVAADA